MQLIVRFINRALSTATKRWLLKRPTIISAFSLSSLGLAKSHPTIPNSIQPRPHVEPNCCQQTKSSSVTFHNNDSWWSSLQRAVVVIKRLWETIFAFYPAIFLSPCLFFNSTQNLWWTVFINAIKTSGPAYIKFAQWASTRPDLFPRTVCKRLEDLHSDNAHHPFSETEPVLRQLFGYNWEDKIEINRTPVGSGCVAQVYRGTLHESNQDVAIKVIHPHVKATIEADIAILTLLANLIETIPTFEWTGACDSVNEFSKLMHGQLDLRNEAKHLQQFFNNFKDDPSISFPHVIDNLVTENVLVESFEESEPISVAFESESSVRQWFAKAGVDMFFRMMFEHNYVHGDLHPGNLRIKGLDKHGNRTSEPLSLLLLDFGIVTELTQQDHKNFIDLFTAIVKHDGEQAGELMLERARKHDCPDPDAFKKDVAALVDKVTKGGNTLDLASVKVGQLLSDVLALTCTHRVKIESNFTSIVIAIMVLEGVGRSLDPNMNLLTLAAPRLLKQKAKMSLGMS